MSCTTTHGVHLMSIHRRAALATRKADMPQLELCSCIMPHMTEQVYANTRLCSYIDYRGTLHSVTAFSFLTGASARRGHRGWCYKALRNSTGITRSYLANATHRNDSQGVEHTALSYRRTLKELSSELIMCSKPAIVTDAAVLTVKLTLLLPGLSMVSSPMRTQLTRVVPFGINTDISRKQKQVAIHEGL